MREVLSPTTEATSHRPFVQMNIARQGVSFVIVGCCLIVVDWAVFVALSVTGMTPVWANVLGRVAGALVGFWANGRVTFGSPGAPRFGYHRFAKFSASWVVVTLLSTVLITELADHLSLQAAWLAKPMVEGALAAISFFVSRHWVYR